MPQDQSRPPSPPVEKPDFLTTENAWEFSNPATRSAYSHRAHYTQAALDILESLLPQSAPTALDVGCGPGDLSIPLAERCPVDAVDMSETLIQMGQQRPGGMQPNLNWITSSIEDAPLQGPYGLITAGESLHWMPWDQVFPRFAEIIDPRGRLALLSRHPAREPWRDELDDIVTRYHTCDDYISYDLVELITQQRYFHPTGDEMTSAEPLSQTLTEFIEQLHSRFGLSRDNMTAADAQSFDRDIESLMTPYLDATGYIQSGTRTRVVWGKIDDTVAQRSP
ncbi:MAG: class I SAM-dependent methyltransferase [Pseudomonadales bacterium]|nr:class I SAM-dependent methyltransferase [Pseudomonadales bacterium]